MRLYINLAELICQEYQEDQKKGFFQVHPIGIVAAKIGIKC
jgi:hypothetical protein